jgi:beta-aspartyl-dipeptidase (metallo-type)
VKLHVVTGAEIYTPDPKGRTDLLFCHEHIVKIGKIDLLALEKSKVDLEIIDGNKKILIPGIIDPHSHILGGSGENGGFSSQTPEIAASEYIRAGTTTVIGTLGVDTTMKTMAGLLAKVKGLNDEGLSSSLYTGGYSVPPATILPSVKQDIMFISEVIGVGELAISDERSEDPSSAELARIVVDSHNSGQLADKAGIVHFHLGSEDGRLKPLFQLLEEFKTIRPEWLYPTHVQNDSKLIEQGIRLTKKGSMIDFDVVEKDLAKSLKTYREKGGSLKHLTVSSDSSKQSPKNIWDQISNCVLHHRFSLETLLPLITSNPAKILKLRQEGSLDKAMRASFLLLDKNNLDITDVYSRGKAMLRDGKMLFKEKFLQECNRKIELIGDEAK